ncbi:MAG: ParB/RepB/Spo0J family partition protein [Chloroflexi bacterium]|nr:ParB/RepB/Spo0J family partition protein [Chloroflexota bacterium]
MAKKRGLGKGLGALIPVSERGPTEVPLDAIVPNPLQPRQKLDLEALEELAASIREHGLIQPLIVSQATDAEAQRYQLIAGERRLEAARLAGLTRVPVIIREATPQEMLELALVENIQRADLNPLEQATAYRHLMDDFGLTQEQVAERVGKSRVAVANSVRLLRLPDEIKGSLAQDQITEGHARAMLALDEPDDQRKIWKAILKRGLNVRQTEETVRRLVAGPKPKPADQPSSPETRALEDRFREALGTKVQLFRSRRGGRLVIHFYSEEELQAFYELIVGDVQ